LDDLGLSSLDQLPLLASVDAQAAVLASLQAPGEDANQATLSLDDALIAVDPEAVPDVPDAADAADAAVAASLPEDATEQPEVSDLSETDAPSADASESPPHD
jgi:hypothetical protein